MHESDSISISTVQLPSPSGHCCFRCHGSEERTHFWGLQSWFWMLDSPYSSSSSKDSGYGECQLGFPTRLIRSARKMDVSKRGHRRKCCFMKATKTFYATGLQCTLAQPLAFVFEGQTIILKGVTHVWVVRCWNRVPFHDTFSSL